MDFQKIDILYSLAECFEAQFLFTPHDGSIPETLDAEGAVIILTAALSKGHPIHPPQPVSVAGTFTGMMIAITGPLEQGRTPELHGSIMIYTPLASPGVQAEQSMIGFALHSLAIAEFIKAQKAPKADEKK